MTNAEFTQDCLRTESTVHEWPRKRILHAALGLCTEAGEFADNVKRFEFYGKNFDETNAIEEIGDILWYCAVALDALGSNFEEAKELNVAKLRERYPEKFSIENALNRDLDAERKAMENER